MQAQAGYDAADLAVKAESHPVYSRYAALVACAQALVAAAGQGVVRREWVVPFVRGVLKFDRTHGYRVVPLDLLVWCKYHPDPPDRLFSYSMNLVDPPTAADPPEVTPNAAVCFGFLRSVAGQPVNYFKRRSESD